MWSCSNVIWLISSIKLCIRCFSDIIKYTTKVARKSILAYSSKGIGVHQGRLEEAWMKPWKSCLNSELEVGEDDKLSNPASGDIFPAASLALPTPPQTGLFSGDTNVWVYWGHFSFRPPWLPSCHKAFPRARVSRTWNELNLFIN